MATFNPAFKPSEELSGRRYVHVIGSSVFVDDRPADPSWSTHFLGMFGTEGVWGVDVPQGDDPSYGAALDLYSFYGRHSEAEWLLAGRAVQVVEWARTHRFCGRCGAQLEYRLIDAPKTVEINYATLDEPSRLRPAWHVWYGDRFPGIEIDDDLPKYDDGGSA